MPNQRTFDPQKIPTFNLLNCLVVSVGAHDKGRNPRANKRNLESQASSHHSLPMSSVMRTSTGAIEWID